MLGCSLNGVNQLIPITPTARQILTLTDTITGVSTIAIDYVAPAEIQMEQWTFHLTSAPSVAVNGEITLSIHRTNPLLNTVLRSVNMATGGPTGGPITDLVCVIPFRWHPGEHVVISYANPENLSGGTQFDAIEVIL